LRFPEYCPEWGGDGGEGLTDLVDDSLVILLVLLARLPLALQVQQVVESRSVASPFVHFQESLRKIHSMCRNRTLNDGLKHNHTRS
jgi:hypothetical protein